ncbi:MAG: PilZ domain-containing protein [Desulfobacteraceae bacterium]|nr:PilZ domain-containing protein [Desulfobacteraceae bacterium]
MKKDNQRRQKRYESVNLLSYVCMDSDGKEWKQGMGRTLNINETGAKLETHEPIETQYIVLLAMGIGEEVVDIKGRVVYCNRGEAGRFESGIEFYDVEGESLTVLREFVEAFNQQYS